GNQDFAAVATAPNGDFVVGWTDTAYRDGYGQGTFARRFSSSGAPLGSDFQLNTYTPLNQGEFGPRLAFDGSGGLVAVWRSDGQDGPSGGVFGRRFNSSGAGLGTEFQINTYTP